MCGVSSVTATSYRRWNFVAVMPSAISVCNRPRFMQSIVYGAVINGNAGICMNAFMLDRVYNNIIFVHDIFINYNLVWNELYLSSAQLLENALLDEISNMSPEPLLRMTIDTNWNTVAMNHDEVIIWKHFLRYWPFVRGIHRSPVNSSHKGQWRGALMFPLICAWINNREAGDMRRYRAHYDVIVMIYHNWPHIVGSKPFRRGRRGSELFWRWLTQFLALWINTGGCGSSGVFYSMLLLYNSNPEMDVSILQTCWLPLSLT